MGHGIKRVLRPDVAEYKNTKILNVSELENEMESHVTTEQK